VSSFDVEFEVDWCRLASARVETRLAQKTQAAGRCEAEASEAKCGRSTESAREVMGRITSRCVMRQELCW
jgi:hypothetical protein